MFLKWILFLSVLNVIDAQYRVGQCALPRLAHGKVRGRQNRRLIKFTCSPGYELVGNRYATCRDGEWDTPKPTCVKPGCPVPDIKNGVKMVTRSEAWVMYFCLPGYRLVGSTAIYCDGKQWNTTAPTCIDTNIPTKLSCDFENPDLCGWTQDSLHDFDWDRLSRKTPSSFLDTGPSYDHTYGEGHSGYYMYTESSSRLQNETARLISPVFEGNLSTNGCFAFYYHMYGRDIGGLRVYQKPDSVPLELILALSEAEKQKYLLFEMWGNQGDFWFGDVSELNDFGEDFQIVIEGIRGKKFTSDIAIDDVAILQGTNCSAAKMKMSTPPPLLPDTCEGRCLNGNQTQPSRGCGCSWRCLMDQDCCRDYFETCLYSDLATTEDTETTTDLLPQTQKLVAKSTTPHIETTTTSTTTKTTTTTTTKKPSPPKVTVTVLIKNAPTEANKTILPKPTTPKYMKNVTIFQKDAISEKPKLATTTVKTTTIAVVTTPKMKFKPTTRPTTKVKTTKEPTTTTTVKTMPKLTTVVSRKTTRFPRARWMEKEKKEDSLQHKSVPRKSSAWKPVLITIAVLMCCGGLVWLVLEARGARGRAAIAALRGRTRNDPEVRYLHADQDDD